MGRVPTMEVPSRHGSWVSPYEKMSCLVPRRTNMLRELVHWNHCTPLTPGQAGDECDLARAIPLLLGSS